MKTDWKQWIIAVFLILISASTTKSQNAVSDKPGNCPEFTIPTSDLCVIECNQDSECPGDNKCCSLISCGSICTAPLIPSPSSQQAIVKTSDSNVDNCKHECDNSKQCGSGSLCVKQGCKRICKSFGKTKSSSSPSEPLVRQVPVASISQIPNRVQRNCTDQCLRDAHCEAGYRCVPNDCRNVCERSAPEPHNIRTLSAHVEECNDRCARDIHCPFGYECMQQGCRKVCYKTSQPLGQSSSNTNTQALPMSNQRQQNTDNCQNECNVDADCNVGYNCRPRGCQNVCKLRPRETAFTRHTANSQILNPPLLDASCQNECNSDTDCNFGFKCRQQGCSRVCKHDTVLESHHQIGRSCKNDCERDSDCLIASFCVQNGCKKECIENFFTTPSTVACHDECTSDRDCNLGYLCLENGCKKTCQKYQPRQSMHRSDQSIFTRMSSNQETRQVTDCSDKCTRDSDCSQNSICTQRGCGRQCISVENILPVGPASPFTRGILDPQNFSQRSNIHTNQEVQHSGLVTTNIEHTICKNECSHNTQCPQNSLCVQDGCNRICRNENLNKFIP